MRFVISSCLLLAACCVLFSLIGEIRHGEVYFSISRLGHGVMVSRADSPRGFWMAVVFNLCLGAWLSYISVAEMIYTVRRRRDRHEPAA